MSYALVPFMIKLILNKFSIKIKGIDKNHQLVGKKSNQLVKHG
jgi:hypothetical protein